MYNLQGPQKWISSLLFPITFTTLFFQILHSSKSSLNPATGSLLWQFQLGLTSPFYKFPLSLSIRQLQNPLSKTLQVEFGNLNVFVYDSA